MRRFVLGWKTLGHQQKLEARIINYADDFVICCRGTANEALTVMRHMMSRTLADGERDQNACLSGSCGNVRLPGLHLRRCYECRKPEGPIWVLPTGPSESTETPCRSLVAALTNRGRGKSLRLDPEEIVGRFQQPPSRLGQSYFCLGSSQQSLPCRGTPRRGSAPQVAVSQAQSAGSGNGTRFPDEYLSQRAGTGPDHLGLPQAAKLSPAKAWNNSHSTYPCPESRIRGNPPVRFDEREVETELRSPRHLSTSTTSPTRKRGKLRLGTLVISPIHRRGSGRCIALRYRN